MRVTPGMTADNAVYNLQQGRAAMDTLQEQISSGMMVNKPSDDPLSSRQILDLQNQISAGDQYSSNITKGTLLLNVADTALSGMSDIMQQVKKIAGDMVSGTADQTSINGAITNLAALKDQLVDLGNTQAGSQYVFAGYGNTQPFSTTPTTVAGTNPALTGIPGTNSFIQTASGAFSGTQDGLSVEIAGGNPTGTQVMVASSGALLLRGGNPPAAVGSGASAGVGPVDILGSIDTLIAAITNGNKSAISDGIKNMKAGADQITSYQTISAGSLKRLNNAQTMITNNQNTLKTMYGNLQNVDYAKAGVELSQQTTAFNAALSTTAKITQLSLLDYMK
jgi:flagellar hook-associated protein 3 FlgL